jgi:phycobilisome core linker protein
MTRLFKVTALIPSYKKIRGGRELQNTYFTKLVEYDRWFMEQQRIQKQGGKILSVKLVAGKVGANTGVS